jgi:N-acetylmuramoyl-L-alanine amidase
MKLVRWLRLSTLTAISLSIGGLGIGLTAFQPEAIASTFDNAEVNQDRFVLLATEGGSRLTILEQISNTRACWDQNGSEVDPLLLNFDFTGICGRASDLNGYSIRVDNQDLGLQYRLEVATEGDSMVLYARSRRGGPRLEVGRTRGIPQEFGEIELNPGWRVTRRVYNGQALGHLYLTNDQTLTALLQESPSRPPTSVATRPTTPSTQPSGVTAEPVSETPSSRPRYRRYSRSGSQLPTPDEPIAIGVETPSLPPTSSNRSAVSGIDLPTPPGGTTVAVVPVPSLPPEPTGHRPPGDPTIPVIPVTQDLWFSEPPVFTGTPGGGSDQLAANLGFSYRVIVSDSSPDAQRRVRSIVPDAFRTVVDGEVVMQAGLFRERNEANTLLQQLNQANLPATLVPVF